MTAMWSNVSLPWSVKVERLPSTRLLVKKSLRQCVFGSFQCVTCLWNGARKGSTQGLMFK